MAAACAAMVQECEQGMPLGAWSVCVHVCPEQLLQPIHPQVCKALCLSEHQTADIADSPNCSGTCPAVVTSRHGDLKAANVLLTAGSIGEATDEVWADASCLPLTAKVADFGLAMSLGPTDTHATMLARVSWAMA